MDRPQAGPLFKWSILRRFAEAARKLSKTRLTLAPFAPNPVTLTARGFLDLPDEDRNAYFAPFMLEPSGELNSAAQAVLKSVFMAFCGPDNAMGEAELNALQAVVSSVPLTEDDLKIFFETYDHINKPRRALTLKGKSASF
jgi:hypothetical protein